MRNFFIGSIFMVGAVFASSPVILAQTASQPRAARSQTAAPTPDLSGVWGLWMNPRGRDRYRSFPEVPSMTPEAAVKYKALNEAVKGQDENKDLMDPIIIACAPPGPTRIMQQGRPFEMIQTPGRVIILYEMDHWVRHVWMDGRGHPKEPDSTWMGHSIGRWDGDALVVDTVGLNDKTWLDSNGHPHSEALHVVERFRRVDHDTLEVAVVYEDPKVYTKPWRGKITFQLNPKAEILEWVTCDDRIRSLLKSDPCKTGAWELEVACDERKQRLPQGK